MRFFLFLGLYALMGYIKEGAGHFVQIVDHLFDCFRSINDEFVFYHDVFIV